jgi:c-di-AMP phosphodiesterase-like protein
MQAAKTTDLICLGLIAFNLALAIHFAVNNWIFTLLILSVSVPITIIFLVKAEGKEKTTDDDQTKIIFTSATSIVGGLVAWLLV